MRMRLLWLPSEALPLVALLLAATLLAAGPSRAGEGVLEINDACAQAGCFAGDGPGYPVFIGQPGSFRLTSNLYPNGANGIQITNNTKIVTIDLNGFKIEGGGVGQGGGIIGGTGASAIVIRNGTINNMAGDGINIGGSSVVESVHVLGNGGDGIDVNQTSMVNDCRVVGNGGFGIRFSDRTSLYSGIVFSGNGAGSVELGRPGGLNYCDDGRCSRWGRRRYYRTAATFKGDSALTACADGFHMASLWEIRETSNLDYDTTLGVTTGDSGSGPPTYSASGVWWAWIRTGAHYASGIRPGVDNCLGWGTASSSATGTGIILRSDFRMWPDPLVAPTDPWTVGDPLTLAFFPQTCDLALPVWCVED